MTYNQLVAVITDMTKCKKKEVKSILDCFQEVCLEEIKHKEEVKMPLLGKLSPSKYTGRKIVLSGKSYKSNSFETIKLTAGKKAKDFLNS